ncbi:MAG: YigZ family protein [Bacilli bacterium]
MKTIALAQTFEQTINKSRFICQLIPVTSVKQAKENLIAIKKTHYQATHHCFAYIIGKNQPLSKFSDDGEPSNTAGSVIYGILNKHSLTNILAVVIRYYGGIKLGAGGLVRAYGSSVALALENATFLPIFDYQEIFLEYEYSYHHFVQKLTSNYQEISKSFNTTISLTLLVPDHEVDELIRQLKDQTKNSIFVVKKETNF